MPCNVSDPDQKLKFFFTAMRFRDVMEQVKVAFCDDFEILAALRCIPDYIEYQVMNDRPEHSLEQYTKFMKLFDTNVEFYQKFYTSLQENIKRYRELYPEGINYVCMVTIASQLVDELINDHIDCYEVGPVERLVTPAEAGAQLDKMADTFVKLQSE